MRRAGVAAILMLWSFCLPACGGSANSDTLSEADRDATIEAMSALELMAVAFDGDYSAEEIREPLFLAMQCFGLTDTERNRERAGDVLVTVSNEHEVAEMEILEEMLAICATGTNFSFPDAASWAAVALVAEPD